MARSPLAAVLVLLALPALTGAPPALADDGVTVDPGSPSAKEYSVPLDSARQAASGTSSSSSAAPQRFGQGVTTEQSAPPAPAKATAKPAKKHKQPHHTAKPAPATPAVATPAPKVAASVVPKAASSGDTGGGTSPALALGGGAAIVLIVGGAVGVWLRRRPAGTAR